MKVEIITIGDEILIGQTIDTNSAWLGENLSMLGISINRITSISDTKEAIAESIDEGFSRVNLLIMTGGLGPTQDDVTKQTLCEYFNTELEINKEVLHKIEELFARFNRPMLESNIQQAALPKAARILLNTRGTAMGMWFEREGKVLISTPGVPHEMKGIMSDYGFAMISETFNTPAIVHRTILTHGIGESFLAEKIKDWEMSLRNSGLSLAYLPSAGMVKLRISGVSQKQNLQQLEDSILNQITLLREIVPEYIFGQEKDTLAKVVGDALIAAGKSVGTAESCTGGYIAHLLTAVPGSSRYFYGSVVAYKNSVKSDVLGVSEADLAAYGAVSKEVVEQMASGLRLKLGVDFAIATSGIAGPDGGTKDKPVGTVWLAVAGPAGVKSEKLSLGKNRERNIILTANYGLNWLRKEILAKGLE